MDLIQLAKTLKSFTDGQLANELKQPSGRVPSYLVLAELDSRKAKRPGNPPKTTVAQDLSDLIPAMPGSEPAATSPQAPAGAGLAALAQPTPGPGRQSSYPSAYADGGIVQAEFRRRPATADEKKQYDADEFFDYFPKEGETEADRDRQITDIYNELKSRGGELRTWSEGPTSPPKGWSYGFRWPGEPMMASGGIVPAHHRPQDADWSVQNKDGMEHHSAPTDGDFGRDSDRLLDYLKAHPDLKKRAKTIYRDHTIPDGGRMGIEAPSYAQGGAVKLPKTPELKSVARENYRLNPMPMPMRTNFLSVAPVGNNWFGGKQSKKATGKDLMMGKPTDRKASGLGTMSGRGNFQNFATGGIVGDEYDFGFDTGGGGQPMQNSPTSGWVQQYMESQRRRQEEGTQERFSLPPERAPAFLRQPRSYPPAPTTEPRNADDIGALPVPGTRPAPTSPTAPTFGVPSPKRPETDQPGAWDTAPPMPQTTGTNGTTGTTPSASVAPGTTPGKKKNEDLAIFESPEGIYQWLRSKEPKDNPYQSDMDELKAWKERIAKSNRNNAGMAIMQTGLGMMASKSPYVGQALGEAGMAATKGYLEQERHARQDELAGISASAKLQEAQQAYNRGEFDKAHKALDDYRKKQLADAYLLRQERLAARGTGTGLSKTDIKEIDQQNIANRQARNNKETQQQVKFEMYSKLKRMPTEQEFSTEMMRRYPIVQYRQGALSPPPPGGPAAAATHRYVPGKGVVPVE